MLEVVFDQHMIRFGERMGISFHRTLRIPEGAQTYPLPPGLGVFPIYQVAEFADRLPHHWRNSGEGFISMYQREALWIGFNAASWKPNAVVIAVGGINAVSGGPLDEPLCAEPQNYLVAPPQPWLDGINSGHGVIRQFIAMPLGAGGTIEAAVSGIEIRGGVQITVFEPKRGQFPQSAPPTQVAPLDQNGHVRPMHTPAQPMGLGAGGRMKQKVYGDPFGVDTWDQGNYGHTTLHIINSIQFQQITGQCSPPTPVDAKLYSEHGLPWFDLYDETMVDIAPSEPLSRVHHDDDRRGEPADPAVVAEGFHIPSIQIETIGQPPSAKRGKDPASTDK
jgi:hypothetical protein